MEIIQIAFELRMELLYNVESGNVKIQIVKRKLIDGADKTRNRSYSNIICKLTILQLTSLQLTLLLQ